MRKQDFSDKSPGHLEQINTPRGPDFAFIPDELPTRWHFDPSLWPRLVTAHEKLGMLDGIGQILNDPNLLIQPLQNREAITSSNIEGTYVTPEELLFFGLAAEDPTTDTEKRADQIEVSNYTKALGKGRELLETLPVCNRVIKAMHVELMAGARGRDKAPGEYRKVQVQLGSDGRFIPPPPDRVDRLMANLERDANATDSELDPLVRCFIAHYQFETIHPFMDGNGRVGRALLALMIQKSLGHAHPWLYLSSYFERYKEEYMSGLYAVSARGDWTTWIDFCLNGVIEQATGSVRRCRMFHDLRNQLLQHEVAQHKRIPALIALLFSFPILNIRIVTERLGITYPTAKGDLKRLIDAAIIREISGCYPQAYLCPAIFDIAYADSPSGPPW